MIDFERQLERYALPAVEKKEELSSQLGVALIYTSPYRQETGHVLSVPDPSRVSVLDGKPYRSLPYIPRIDGESYDGTLYRGVSAVFDLEQDPSVISRFFRQVSPAVQTVRFRDNGQVKQMPYVIGCYISPRGETSSREDVFWVEPTLFYDRKRTEGMSSLIIEDLFVSGAYTDIVPLYHPKPRVERNASYDRAWESF